MADIEHQEYGTSPVKEISRFRLDAGKLEKQTDLLSVEEPLEIILLHGEQEPLTIAITMRTPGNDAELAAGFLFAEGIIKRREDIESIAHDPEAGSPANTIKIKIGAKLAVDPGRLQKYFFTHSACGVCGKTAVQALEMLHQPRLLDNQPVIDAKLLCELPRLLRKQQQQFAATGGAHSAALFSTDGKILELREDVGRHNALDKLTGSLLLAGTLQTSDKILLVSGRASFELVQKALMADIGFLAAIGAPTSLAVQLASRHGMTLVGFVKADGFNVYSAPERIR